jgi:hypothetical protein
VLLTVCGSEAKYSKTCKRIRAQHDGRLPWPKYGHVEKLAHEIAAGAREAGASADGRRVPELLSPEAAKAANYEPDETTSPSTMRSS